MCVPDGISRSFGIRKNMARSYVFVLCAADTGGSFLGRAVEFLALPTGPLWGSHILQVNTCLDLTFVNVNFLMSVSSSALLLRILLLKVLLEFCIPSYPLI